MLLIKVKYSLQNTATTTLTNTPIKSGDKQVQDIQCEYTAGIISEFSFS